LSRFLIHPGYLARATIWVDVVDPRARTPDAFQIGGQLGISTGWDNLLKSDAVMDYVVHKNKLYLGWENAVDSAAFEGFDLQDRFRLGLYTLKVDSAAQHYSLMGEDGALVESGTVGDSVGRSLGWRWAPPVSTLPKGHVIAFSVSAPHETGLSLATAVAVRSDADGNFMRLELKDPDPEFAATVNAVSDS
jgi:hypothetical protein